MKKREDKFGAVFMCKNNEDVIERMLDSIIDNVDEICACDTGSTDKTLDILQKYKVIMEKNGKTLKIYQDTWKNFEYNRTLMSEHALQMDVDFYLMLDSDETAEFKPGFFNRIKNNNQPIEFYNVKDNTYAFIRNGIFKNDRYWLWCGWVHEDVIYPTEKPINDDIVITIYSNGVEHLTRNKLLLELEMNESSTRRGKHITEWYLALTYFELGEYDKSVNKTLNVINTCVDNPKCGINILYSSYYNLGLIYKIQNKVGNVEYNLMASTIKPYRAEPFYEIGLYYNQLKQYNLAKLFLTHASTLKQPKNDYIVEINVYKYLIDFELSVALYYGDDNDRKKAKNIMEKLYKMELPENIKKLNKGNLDLYK